jgi:putative hydrolase of the HAD superfamily
VAIDVAFFDIGGPLYDDRRGYLTWFRAIREVAPGLTEEEFWGEFDRLRREQSGSFARSLVATFAPGLADAYELLRPRAHRAWGGYRPDELFPDAAEVLEALSGRFRLGLIANQPRSVRDALTRDDLARYFELWAISEEVGVQKPDAGIFQFALREAQCPAHRCVMVGDRLDNDVVASKRLGMRAVWLLRGEAPDSPTPEQTSLADASIASLRELPEVLRQWWTLPE